MARSCGKGVLSLGLINIPVKFYPTGNSSAKISFNLLSDTGKRLKQQYIDQDTDEVIDLKVAKRGYEYAKEQYVMFTPDEITALNETASPNIVIDEFVPSSSITQLMVEKTYYLVPDVGGSKAYSLLSQSLAVSGRVGIAQWSTRGKQHLMAISPFEDGLAIHQLLFSDEIAAYDEVRVATEKCSDKELQLARLLIDSATKPSFDHSKYVDTVKARIEKAIEAKINGQELVLPAPEKEKEATDDLMAALMASLKVANGG